MMPTRRGMGRRELLGLAGATGLGVLLAACGGSGAPDRAGAPVANPPVANPPAAQPAVPAAEASPPAAARETTLRNPVVPGPTLPAAVPTPGPRPTATPRPYDAARLKDALGSAKTSYAAGLPARRWNVELAAKNLSGTTVEPGGLFSFNEAVGPTTLDAGFRVGFGITSQGGALRTVPSVAGGICQVATTVFQAAFWAGLPFAERHYHSYWIPRYGQPPSGRVGLDATVDDPNLDLKFRNTTDDWIRVDARAVDGNLSVEIKGVHPGWDVETTQPRVSNVVKADRTYVREYEPTMPPGQEIEVEHAEDGFSVTMTRLVKAGGKTIDEYTFTNRYQPSRNVILVGGQPPAPTRPAAATGTPAPQASATAPPQAATPPPVTNATPPPPAKPTPTGPQPTAPPKPAVSPTAGAPSKAGAELRVPSVVGMPEARARAAIDAAGLANTHANYQGPGQVPKEALESVPPGAVLSQTPAAGTPAAPRSVVYLAVRKE
jgi:hypothetical protein